MIKNRGQKAQGTPTKLTAVIGDITKESSINGMQAIVNAANRTLLGGGGVDGAIHKAAGPRLYGECLMLGGCRTGDAKMTDAYRIPCEKIIHTVGPIYYDGKNKEPEQLASCYKKSLTVAKQAGLKTVAFPSVSTGIFGYPVEEAADIAVKTVADYTKKNPGSFSEIRWVLFDDTTFTAYDQAIKEYAGQPEIEA
jgi:O-acetyl-ADP-ribose deacetylase (regulator of RNase III)